MHIDLGNLANSLVKSRRHNDFFETDKIIFGIGTIIIRPYETTVFGKLLDSNEWFAIKFVSHYS